MEDQADHPPSIAVADRNDPRGSSIHTARIPCIDQTCSPSSFQTQIHKKIWFLLSSFIGSSFTVHHRFWAAGALYEVEWKFKLIIHYQLLGWQWRSSRILRSCSEDPWFVQRGSSEQTVSDPPSLSQTNAWKKLGLFSPFRHRWSDLNSDS